MQRTKSSHQKTDPDPNGISTCTVVLDNGSFTSRAGLASEERPSLIMPSIVGRRTEGGTERVFFGDDVLAKAGEEGGGGGGEGSLRRSYSVCYGLVMNWEDLAEMWTYVLEQKLQRRMEESPLVVMESAYMVPKITREKLTELAFETFNVPVFSLPSAPEAILGNHHTGLVIDIGRDNVRVVPVYEGYRMLHAIMKFEMGSESFTHYLGRLLQEGKGVPLDTLRLHEVRRIKEELAFVAQDHGQELKAEAQERSFTLSNGDALNVGRERFQCVEVLFQPALLGMEMWGLAEHVLMTVCKASPDLTVRQSLLSNVVLVGGGSKLPGLATRLQRELEGQLGSHDQADLHELQVQVVTAPEGDLAVWQAGSCLVRSAEFHKKCIGKAEYDERGPSVVHEKCW